MLNDMDQRTRLLYPLFQNILTKLNPSYRSVEITGNSKVRYLKYRYPNRNYERRRIDGEDCSLFGFLLFLIIGLSIFFLRIPNVFWSNFCFYVFNIGIITLVYINTDNIKEAIVMCVIILSFVLLSIGVTYWVSHSNLDDCDAIVFYKNVSALWPDFIFKFVFK